MPLVTVRLNPGNTGANFRELHNQLLAISEPLASSEQAATSYGPSTIDAVHTFQQ